MQQLPDYEDLLRRVVRLERLSQRLDDLEQDIGRSGISSIGHARFHGDGDHLPPLLKTANQIVNNSTTLVAISSLGLQVGINETWSIEMFLLYRTSDVADIKFGWSYPTGTTIRAFTTHLSSTGVTVVEEIWLETIVINSHGNVGVDTAFWARAVIYTGANPGVVSPTYAQNTAEVSDTKVLTGSILLPRRII